MKLLFVYLPIFERTAAELLTDDVMQPVEQELLRDPRAGDVVPGSGGVRKLRVALPGRGKRGSARLIYLYVEGKERVYFILAFAKNVRATLTAAELQRVRVIVQRLQEEV